MAVDEEDKKLSHSDQIRLPAPNTPVGPNINGKDYRHHPKKPFMLIHQYEAWNGNLLTWKNRYKTERDMLRAFDDMKKKIINTVKQSRLTKLYYSMYTDDAIIAKYPDGKEIVFKKSDAIIDQPAESADSKTA